MTRNEGTTDRLIRILAGLALIGAWPFGLVQGGLAVVLGLLGGVLLITGAVGFCPLYALVGLNSCPADTTRR